MAGSPNTITINFPSQITKIESEIFPGGEITSSGLQSNTAGDGGIYTLACTVKNGYKISNCVYSNAGNAELRGFTDTTITLKAGTGGLGGTLDISVAQVAQKAISLSNLTKFKELCDQTYAKTGGSGGGTQLYKHETSDGLRRYIIISTNSAQYNTAAAIYNDAANDKIISFATYVSGNKFNCIFEIGSSQSSGINLYYIDTSDSGLDMRSVGPVGGGSTTYTDTVTPL